VTNPKSPKLTDGQAGNPFEADKHLHPQPPKATATTTHLLGAGELDCITIIRQTDRQPKGCARKLFGRASKSFAPLLLISMAFPFFLGTDN